MPDELPHAQIKHVIVLMLENRGFDHLMGSLYAATETPNIVSSPGDTRPFIGLSTLSPDQLQAYENPLPHGFAGGPIAPMIGARAPNIPSWNPGESFGHILSQMHDGAAAADLWLNPFLRPTMQATTPPSMTGYARDFCREVEHHGAQDITRDTLAEVMETYLPEQMPVLSGLARAFAVSDEWFCSVPSQTNTNRAWSMAGTSKGMVNNSFYDPWRDTWWLPMRLFMAASGGVSNADSLPGDTRTLFHVLEAAGFTWRLYWQSSWPPAFFSEFAPADVSQQYVRTMFPAFNKASYDGNFVQFDGFRTENHLFDDIRRGTLPAVSWVEPAWGGAAHWAPDGGGGVERTRRQMGNDMHPVCDTTIAEDFVSGLYQALTESERWADTLLVITFDENGGTYDHVIPPGVPSADIRTKVPLGVDNPDKLPGFDSTTRTQFGFNFDQLGVRVPTLLISPHVPSGTLFRSTVPGQSFDHTSIIASILSLANLNPAQAGLGPRVAAAPTFVNLLGGPARLIPQPLAALAVTTPRPQDGGLRFRHPYLLQVEPNPWGEAGPVRYLSVREVTYQLRGGGIVTQLEPFLETDRRRATAVSLRSTADLRSFGQVYNMDSVLLQVFFDGRERFLAVTASERYCFLERDWEDPKTLWQVRAWGSRDPGQVIAPTQRLSLFTQSPLRDELDGAFQDLLQRLVPHPAFPDRPTTRGGVWGICNFEPLKVKQD